MKQRCCVRGFPTPKDKHIWEEEGARKIRKCAFQFLSSLEEKKTWKEVKRRLAWINVQFPSFNCILSRSVAKAKKAKGTEWGEWKKEKGKGGERWNGKIHSKKRTASVWVKGEGPVIEGKGWTKRETRIQTGNWAKWGRKTATFCRVSKWPSTWGSRHPPSGGGPGDSLSVCWRGRRLSVYKERGSTGRGKKADKLLNEEAN